MVRLVILTVGRRRVMGVYGAVCVVRLVILSTELCVW